MFGAWGACPEPQPPQRSPAAVCNRKKLSIGVAIKNIYIYIYDFLWVKKKKILMLRLAQGLAQPAPSIPGQAPDSSILARRKAEGRRLREAAGETLMAIDRPRRLRAGRGTRLHPGPPRLPPSCSRLLCPSRCCGASASCSVEIALAV